MPRTHRQRSTRLDLVELVKQLTQELTVLRQAVDELREEIQWGNRNPVELPSPFRLRSMALDPAADDWAERLNRLPDDSSSVRPVPIDATPPTPTPGDTLARQTQLW